MAHPSPFRRMAAFLVILAASPSASAGEAIGVVAAARGVAFLDRAAGRLSATKGADVLLDDTAQTGDDSRLDLRLGEATQLRLGSRASVKIDRFVAGLEAVTTLNSGPLLVERGKGAPPKFEVKTPYALLAARGTVFFAGPSDGVFGVYVKSGVVDVQTFWGAVRLTPGQGTNFKQVGDPPSPPKVWTRPRVDAALRSVR